jgi:hypothetical protein
MYLESGFVGGDKNGFPGKEVVVCVQFVCALDFFRLPKKQKKKQKKKTQNKEKNHTDFASVNGLL